MRDALRWAALCAHEGSRVRAYSFGPFRLDCDSRLLFRQGVVVLVGPKVVDTLIVLVENRARLVEKASQLS